MIATIRIRNYRHPEGSPDAFADLVTIRPTVAEIEREAERLSSRRIILQLDGGTETLLRLSDSWVSCGTR
jgi:hypothetical protein